MPRNYNKQATQLLPAYLVYFLGLLVPGSGVELASQSLPGLDVAAANPPTGVQRDPFIESFEQALDSARQWARFIGFLHALSRFLAVCNLTWATVVLLGAFVSNLIPSDFWFVLVLLLLEAAHLASASFFVCLLMRPLGYQSQAPQNIDHGEDGHYPRSRHARSFSYMVQCILIIPRMVLSFIGFYRLSQHDLKTPMNLKKSLYIFYISAFCNSVVAISHLILSATAFESIYKTSAPGQRPQQSILRYLDTILQNAQSSGLVQADDFDLFHFAYTMLGGEFRRNVQPEAVAKNHKDLIKYLYFHRLGVDFLQIYLDEKDAYVQLAAVNMVGFWADVAWGGLESEVKLPKELLTKLADKVGAGQVGWAATTCIGVLANMPKWTDQLAQTHNSTGERLLDRLADTMDVSSRSLAIVRALVRLYEQLCRNEQGPPDPFTDTDTNLVPKLTYLAERAKVQRLRVQAAYLLSLMGKPCNGSIIAAIKPTVDKYWFRSEKEMLMLLRGDLDSPTEQFPDIREDKNINPPLWARLGGSTA